MYAIGLQNILQNCYQVTKKDQPGCIYITMASVCIKKKQASINTNILEPITTKVHTLLGCSERKKIGCLG